MATQVSSIPINVTLDRPQSKDVVRALLHAVLFHRLFGTIKPQTIDVLDVTFPGVADPDIESLINSKVEEFWRALDTIPGGNGVTKKGQILIILSEKRQKKIWFSMAEEEVPWEQWIINIEILPPRPQASNYYSSSSTRPTFTKQPPPPTPMDQVLLQILTHVSSAKGRDAVPPITTGGVISPFPLKVEVRIGDQMI